MPAPVTNDEKCSLSTSYAPSTGAGTSLIWSVRSSPAGKSGAGALDMLGETGGAEGGDVGGAGGLSTPGVNGSGGAGALVWFSRILESICDGLKKGYEAGRGITKERATRRHRAAWNRVVLA